MAGEEEPPRDNPFNCHNRAKGGVWYKWHLSSFLSHFKTLSNGPAPGIEPATRAGEEEPPTHGIG